jgi:hypothetical protein
MYVLGGFIALLINPNVPLLTVGAVYDALE